MSYFILDNSVLSVICIISFNWVDLMFSLNNSFCYLYQESVIGLSNHLDFSLWTLSNHLDFSLLPLNLYWTCLD